MNRKIPIIMHAIFLCFLYVYEDMEIAFEASLDFIETNDLTNKTPKEISDMIYDYVKENSEE